MVKHNEDIYFYSLHIILLLIIISPNVRALTDTVSTIPSSGSISYPSSESTKIHRIIFAGAPMSTTEIAQKADSYMCHIEGEWRIPQLKAINPDLQCLLYRNIRAVKERYPSEYQTFVNNNWILRDFSGNRIYSTRGKPSDI